MQLSFDIEKNVRSFQQVSEPHFHDGYEVLLCLSDGGKFHVQEQEYPLCRGMMFVLPPKTIHRCVVDIASYERYILHFCRRTLYDEQGAPHEVVDEERRKQIEAEYIHALVLHYDPDRLPAGEALEAE